MKQSPATLQTLKSYEALIRQWQGSINLISPGTLNHLWERHILDSLQLADFLPERPQKIIDLGSGAGFPAIVLAIATGHEFHLVESDKRKSIFLKECVRNWALNAEIHTERIESLTHANPRFSGAFDVITARACADLSALLSYAFPFMKKDAICLFLKGENYTKEIEGALKDWAFLYEAKPSRTHPSGVILRISEVTRTS